MTDSLIYCIIPARAGSKGVPGKNWRKLGDLPLVCYSVELALSEDRVDHIIVSTDSNKIKDLIHGRYSSRSKIKTHERPLKFAQDHTTMDETIIDIISFYDIKSNDKILLLQPTSPFRTKSQLSEFLDIQINSNELLTSFNKLEHGKSWLFTKGNVFMFKMSDQITHRRQDDETIYTLNGAFYLFNVEDIQTNSKLFYGKIKFYIMDNLSSLDIDTIADWNYAEYLMNSGVINIDYL